MKQKGIKKEIDSLRRILIPKHIRESLGFEKDKLVEIFIIEEGLLIKKSNDTEGIA